MPKVHHVKKALKDNRVCKKGESYYWWKVKTGPASGIRRMSKTYPKSSQLTTSEFLGSVYSLQEEMADAKFDTIEDLQAAVEDWVSQIEEIRDNCQEKFDNMPEGLQQGETGQLLEERVSLMDDWANNLQGVDLEPENDKTDVQEFIAEKLEEIGQNDPGV